MDKVNASDVEGLLQAIHRSQAVIEFNLDGTIIRANENFCQTVGYAEEEIKGQHHRIFCDPMYAESQEYREFWWRLNQGEFDAGQYKRFGKQGQEIWIQASYNPILGDDGKPFKVVKFATNITGDKIRNADFEGKIAAIHKAQAVIEFNLDGTIICANENFCQTVGYAEEEIKGQHHRIFCEPDHAESSEYAEFWERLNLGQYDAGQYKRVGKNGEAIWIQASYNPILDADGNPFKVVKFATNITGDKIRNADFEGKIAAIGKAQAVIEFN
ncbi:MAG: PAS domain-containing protein, partial [Zetaproteobacteria bacterium]|nr:PAS domain-containing protein [Zetaproteobacteria bacterium]